MMVMMTHTVLSQGVKNPRRRWTQKEFVLTTFKVVPNEGCLEKALIHAKEAGFNYVEFTWTNQQVCRQAVEICDRLGLKAMVQDTSLFGGFQESIKGPEDQESLKKAVELYGSHKSLGVYYVWDEPYPEQFECARRQIDILEELDPDRLPFTVALPSYNPRFTWQNGQFSDYLGQYAEKLDPPVFSMDYYPFFWEIKTSQDLDRSNVWKDLGCQWKKALEKGIPLWFYIQSVGDVPNNLTGGLTAEQVRVQVYYTLLHGAKGISYYNIISSIVTFDGEKGDLFESTKQLNAELSNLGKTLLHLTSRAIYHGGAVEDPYADAVKTSKILEDLPEHISAGLLEDAEGRCYLLVMNRDFEKPVSASVSFREPQRVYEVDKGDGSQRIFLENSLTLPVNLAPGDGALYRLQKAEEPAYLVEYVIGA